MKNALQRLDSKPQDEIEQEVIQYQLDDVQKRWELTLTSQPLEKQNFVLICHKCHAEVAAGSDVRLYTKQHRVVVGDDFKERVRYEDVPAPSKFTKSEIKCKDCNRKWGTTFKIEQLEVPVLKVTAVLFKLPSQTADDKGHRKFKKWSSVPFVIEPITKAELLDCFRKMARVA